MFTTIPNFRAPPPATTLPTPVKFGVGLQFVRREVEIYKAALAGRPPPPDAGAPAEFLTARQLARELSVSRRWIGRRLAEARARAAA